MRSVEIENEVHQARQKIHEKTKDMTSKERVNYMNTRGEALAKKYGFKIAPSAEITRDEIISKKTAV
jgi:hypothetical protein